jgi:putative phosphoserine phosphatase / 1-acylglycerol-3-phosphate O-acyltransferase
MPEASAAVFVDLDRTLLRQASGPVLHDALVAEGVLSASQHLPGERYLYAFYNRFGESAPFIGLARAAARAMCNRSAEATRQAGKRAVGHLVDLVQPWALEALDAHRRQGRTLVLATTSPADLVTALADALGFDATIATRYEEVQGLYTGRLDGGFVWGTGKRHAVRRWAEENDIDLATCHAYSDSVYDLPFLSAVGHPHPLNADPRLALVAVARRWPLEYWDRPPGIPSLFGLEPYHVVRLLFRPEAFPYARFDIQGVEQIPERGPVLLAANHRSYFDVAAIGLVAARLRRPVRFMAKQEIFDAPIIGRLARSLGGIPVDRGSGSSEPMRQAAAALRAGEVVIVLPQGTIPRGEAFFDVELTGKTGTARLSAETGAPVVPVGLWGTEAVWPRSSQVPHLTALGHPPRVTVRVGKPLVLDQSDATAATATLMAAISGLLPEESRIERLPTRDELARTQPTA